VRVYKQVKGTFSTAPVLGSTISLRGWLLFI